MNNLDQIKQNITCPICDKHIDCSGFSQYHITNVKKLLTPIYYCPVCAIYVRDVKINSLIEHNCVVSYVQQGNENKFWLQRKGFFSYLIDITNKIYKKRKRISSRVTSWLDYGTSYGHLLQILSIKGIVGIGIEINEEMIQLCKQKGFITYRDLNLIPNNTKFNVCSFIDSLYYVSNPVELLRNVHDSLIEKDGILLIRVTNRNFLVKFMKLIGAKGCFDFLGDAMVSYSSRGIRKLLEKTGFQVIHLFPDLGKEKKIKISIKFFYYVSYILTILIRFINNYIVLTPGIIIFAVRKEDCGSQPE